MASFVSLYCGAGGLDLGFVEAGHVPVWANDVDPVAVATYNTWAAARGLEHRAQSGDITSIELPARGSADLVIGGPPCQGFSVAGCMNPEDPRSQHVWRFLEVVEHVQPMAFVMENVKALAVNRRWEHLIRALSKRAEELGFSVSLHVLNAAQHGVPQARERMFLIGLPVGTPDPVIEAPTAEQAPTVREALAQLPRYGEPGNDSICTARVTPAKRPVLRRSPYAGMLFNGQGRPLDLDQPAPTLPASMGGNRTPIIDQLQLDEGASPWVAAYHQHLWDGGGPYTRVPERLRRLTVEEAAALQTFPAGLAWQGQQSAKYRQIGNAVPPRLAFHVAKAVEASLAGAEPAADDLLTA